MSDFVFPSDQDRADDDELNRVCTELEDVMTQAESDEQMANIYRVENINLRAKLARYTMDAGHAEQRQAESRAVRKALGFGEDADDVSPRELENAIDRLKMKWFLSTTIEKEAARYRFLKTAKTGSLGWGDGWVEAEDADEWDEMIDHAINRQAEGGES